MAYNFSLFEKNTQGIEDHLKQEFASIRTGRATPVILDAISAEAYGTRMALREIASITVEDPKTIRVTPWDSSIIKAIEKGVIDSNLGLSVSVDDRGLRVIFPELTSERRASLVKLLKQKHEEARISLRQERERVKNDIEAEEKKGGMGEDDKFRYLEELQKKVDTANERLDEIALKKEKEILE